MDEVVAQSDPPVTPFRRVIVGIDERRRGLDAVSLARSLVSGEGTLLLAHVCVHAAPAGSVEAPVIGRLERRRALGLLATVLEDLQFDAELVCVGARSVGRGLHQLAIAERADLVVIGSCRRAAHGRVMISEATSAALNGAPGAIAIAPRGYAESPTPLREIGVADNSTVESRAALAVARALAVEHGARVSALHAVSVAPGEELALDSASLDLLVVGSRGEDPIGRLSHGSTARRLAGSCRCPLLVLTRDAPTRAVRHQDELGPPPSSATGARR